MRVLWVSKETPDLQGHGGQRRQYFQVRLAVEHGASVTVVTPQGEQDDSAVRRLASVVRFGSGRRWRPGPSTAVRHALDPGHDRVVIAHAESLDLLDGRHGEIQAPWLMDFQNVNSRWYRSLGDGVVADYWDGVELTVMESASMATVCSAREARSLPPGRAEVAIATNGIDADEWPASSEGPPSKPQQLSAFGSWWYPPNLDGLVWFMKQVWPLILDRAPAARFVVAGPGVSPTALRDATQAEHVGRVPDVASFLRTSSAVVVPVLRNPGTPVKFAEALASGVPVVATSGAGAGFPDSPATLTDDPEQFAAACLTFLQDERASRERGEACREYALEHCTWSTTMRPLLRWLSP